MVKNQSTINKNQPAVTAAFSTSFQNKRVKAGLILALVVFLALFPHIVRSDYTEDIFVLTFIYLVVAVSLRTITISGQFPLGHAAFMGIGAYVAAMASKWLDWPAWLTIPSGAIAAMAIGMLMGFPFSRLRATYYAMGSLFFGIGIAQIINAGGVITGGYAGIVGIHPILSGSRILYYYFFLGLAIVSIIALYRFEFSRIGTDLKAIAQSHLVASSVGINESWYRVLVVGVGCFFAGLAGAGYAHYNLVLTSSTFNMTASLMLFMYVLVGGMDSFAGPIIGTIILVMIPQFFSSLKEYTPFISAGIVLLAAYLMPSGIASLPQAIRLWYQEKRKGEEISNAS